MSLSGSSGNRVAIANINNGRDENEEDRLLISASVLWQASDSLELQYTYGNESDDSDTPALLNLSNTGDLLCTNSAMNQDANCAILTDISTLETESLANTSQNFSNNRSYNGNYHTIRAELDFWNHHFTSITGLRATEENTDQDLEATLIDFYSSSIRSDYDQVSQEFRIYSQYSDTFQYLLGDYFFRC
ncbi:MAG: iron complex outermembrane receptor protein [Candidatus Azotimanducaceae bacterium]